MLYFVCVHFLLANIYEQEILSCYEPLGQLLNQILAVIFQCFLSSKRTNE